jgi:hypothetical protein
MMDEELKTLTEFEENLNPQKPEKSPIPAEILGYGEISTIFRVNGLPGFAYKRMPLFSNREEAERYAAMYRKYCEELSAAGINLPENSAIIVETPEKPVALYIRQALFNPNDFCHKRIHNQDDATNREMLKRVVGEIGKIWNYNRDRKPELELSLDGQLSNWVETGDKILFVDTSTPLFKISGKEQMDPELVLQSAPSFLKWIIRLLFLDDVMNRYYRLRDVCIDLAANLFKEQRPELIPMALDIINDKYAAEFEPVTYKEVENYYKEDKMIWILFLAFRRFDQWLSVNLLKKPYHFILPGKIKR